MTDDLRGAAQHFPDPYRLLIRESVASTNDELQQLGNKGAEDGLVLLALHQSAGRGRRGATWFSSTDDALAFSVLLRPTEPKALWSRLALATGLAVAEAAESFGCNAGIKWPNDVWIDGRKVAGILVEAGHDFVVIGIGINVNTSTFPEEIQHLATSLHLANGRPMLRSEVLSAIIQRLAVRRQQINHEFGELLDAVRQRCVLSGHQVSMRTAQGSLTGIIDRIGDGGELRLQTASGIQSLIQADEIRILD